jgi:glutamate carboxypeptidase
LTIWASAVIDVLVPRQSDRKVIEQKVYALKPIHPEARLEISGGVYRPAMERPQCLELFRRARELGRQMVMEINEGSSGGSDGNLAGALGTPTLDGLGAVGDGPHAGIEHVIVRDLPLRAALLATLLIGKIELLPEGSFRRRLQLLSQPSD